MDKGSMGAAVNFTLGHRASLVTMVITSWQNTNAETLEDTGQGSA